MANVTSCTIDRAVSATVDSVNIGTYTLRFNVETDGAMGPQEVANECLSASPHPIPAMWATWDYLDDSDALSYAQEYQIERDPQVLRRYYITVKYKPADPSNVAGDDGTTATIGDPILATTNPLSRPPVIWWDRETYTRKVYKTVTGDAIVNACYAPFEDCHEEEETRGVMVVEFNVATLAEVIELSSTFERAVNHPVWNKWGRNFPSRTVICREMSSGPPIKENPTGSFNGVYYRMVGRFAFADYDPAKGWDTWDASYIQNGSTYWKLNEGGGSYVADEAGIPKRFPTVNGEPVLLKEDGTRLPQGETPVTKRFRVKREVDFNSLPF